MSRLLLCPSLSSTTQAPRFHQQASETWREPSLPSTNIFLHQRSINLGFSSFNRRGLSRLKASKQNLRSGSSIAAVVQTRAGLPVISSVPVLGPVANLLLSPIVMFAIYAFGATRFFSGFSRTTYTDALPTKLGLTIAWPVLFLASQKFRGNFKKAVG